MKKLFVAMCSVLLMLGVGTSRSFASAPGASTQDIQVNVNGTYYDLINDIPGGSANPGYGTGSRLPAERSAVSIPLTDWERLRWT